MSLPNDILFESVHLKFNGNKENVADMQRMPLDSLFSLFHAIHPVLLLALIVGIFVVFCAHCSR